VTRPTGYKWLARHRASGRAGLADRSRAPHLCPHRTSDATEALIVEARQEYDWGVKPQRLRKLTVPAVAMSPNRSVAINRTMLGMSRPLLKFGGGSLTTTRPDDPRRP
jgi:hypothetical protein